MKYDDASWHYGGDFPTDLPEEAGATHIAMFLSWAVLNGLGSELHTIELKEDLAKLRRHEVTPGEWFLAVCDGKFTDEDLSTEGNRFASAYYGSRGKLHLKPGSYLADYDQAFLSTESVYHVPDTWETQALLSKIVDSRFLQRRKGSKLVRALLGKEG